MDSEAMAQDASVVQFNAVRTSIKGIAGETKTILESTKGSEVNAVENRGEVLANLTLAYRHLEDASMRIGKAIQARDGGVSVYDRATTVGA